MAQERLQKILARAGLASRRACEELITAGRVKVDGRVVMELGVKADARRSKIEVDNREVHAEPFVYILLHKPRGVVCTLSDPEGRPTVGDLMRSVPVRLAPVGRLDYQTSGALLMTNDGEFSAKLQHPSGQATKVYVAKVEGELDDAGLEAWRQSIIIDGRATQPAEVRRFRIEAGKTWLEVTLREGRHRQVRRLGEAAGNFVMRLARLSQAGINTDGLRPGHWRHLSMDELVELKRKYGVPKRLHSGARTLEGLSERGGRSARGGTRVHRRSVQPSGASPRSGAATGRARTASGPAVRRSTPLRRDAFGDESPRRAAPRRHDAFGESYPPRDAVFSKGTPYSHNAYAKSGAHPKGVKPSRNAAYSKDTAPAKSAGYSKNARPPRDSAYSTRATYPKRAASTKDGVSLKDAGYPKKVGYSQKIGHPKKAGYSEDARYSKRGSDSEDAADSRDTARPRRSAPKHGPWSKGEASASRNGAASREKTARKNQREGEHRVPTTQKPRRVRSDS